MQTKINRDLSNVELKSSIGFDEEKHDELICLDFLPFIIQVINDGGYNFFINFVCNNLKQTPSNRGAYA